MIAEQIQAQNSSYATTSKYYQFSSILEHVIQCFYTIVTDETNPYHPPLAWLARKQPKEAGVELFLDLHDECSKRGYNSLPARCDNFQLSSNVRGRLEKCPQQQRREIVSRTRDGCTPLFMACKNGLTRVVKYLLDVCGADIEQTGRFETPRDHHVHSVAPIWVAAVSGHLDTVKLLIQRGANINSTSDTGSTTLRSVCFLCDDNDIADDYNFQDDEYGFGENLDKEDESDNYMKIVRLLVENGADIKRPNFNGGTCLINSLHNYHLTDYLIKRGVEINDSDNQSKTALHYAIHQNRIHVVKLLLENGADPYLKTKNSDDALRLSCIGGHEEIFEHLLENYNYDAQTIADANKLLGSSILEIQCDLARVRKYWTKSLEVLEQTRNSATTTTTTTTSDPLFRHTESTNNGREACDIRRSKAFSNMSEFYSQSSMQQLWLDVDDIRVQSLIISERILGPNHPETIQRLLYRGTFYINSLRPVRCLDLWIYALKLCLDTESIFHFESIFAAQAITKLFLDLLGQHQQQHHVRFSDVYDVLQLLIERLDECEQHLSWRPRSCLHEDMYNLLLNMIVKLTLIMRSIRREREEYSLADSLISELVRLDPRTTTGSSLLHICVNANMFEGDIHRPLQLAASQMSQNQGSLSTTTTTTGSGPPDDDGSAAVSSGTSSQITQEQPSPSGSSVSSLEPDAPIFQLIEGFIKAGLEVESVDGNGLSALQVLCLASAIRLSDKTRIIELLLRHGAHFDRRALTPEQDVRIRQTLRECGIKPMQFVTLKCLSARTLSRSKLLFDKKMLCSRLIESLAIH